MVLWADGYKIESSSSQNSLLFQLKNWHYYIIIIIIIIIFVITFTHGTHIYIYIYIPETQLFLQYTVLQLFCIYNLRNM
jgi:hypothetical protein